MKVEIQIIEYVWVELTVQGYNALRNYVAEKNKAIHQRFKKITIEDFTDIKSKYYKFKICDLMCIFGPHFNCSVSPPFTDGIINLIKPTE